MNLKPIKTKADYQQALREIESLFEVESNTPEWEKLDILTTLVEVYEQQHHPILSRPTTDMAKNALDTCHKYVWQTKQIKLGSTQ